ncbi:MAG: efflux RND transporter periplasmic adaptor subunit [Lachnospiraceae bacterium]|nr:efflux RND transporter periplasmic adaptor subunit [Lachnospiraceae bacterium]
MKKTGIIVTAALLACAAGGGSYYHFVYKKAANGTGRVSSQSEDAVYVNSVEMLAGLMSADTTIQRYAGVVEPQETWSAKTGSDKTIAETFVKVGDTVKKGDKLFAYDTSEDEDKLVQTQIDKERATNDIDTTRVELEQAKKEKEKASADAQLEYTVQIATLENSIKQNEYENKQRDVEMKNLQDAIASADVKSELDGVVKSINDTNKSNAGFDGGSDAYITIMAVGDFRIKGSVNEQNFRSIEEGMDVLAFSRVDPEQYWRGQITQIKTDNSETNQSDSSGFGDSSDNGTNSTVYPFYVQLESSEGLMLGQHLYLEPDVGQTSQRDGIWLESYYFNDLDTDSVWVWAADGKNLLEKRSVQLGDYDEEMDRYQILEGLEASDYICAPQDMLEVGAPVIYVDYGAGVMQGDESAYWEMEGGSFEEWGGDFGGSWEDWDYGGSWEDGDWDDAGWDDEEWDDEEWSDEDGEEVDFTTMTGLSARSDFGDDEYTQFDDEYSDDEYSDEDDE